MTRPPRYKQAVVSWLGVYPLITLLLWLLGPVVSDLPLPLVTLVLTLVLVSLQTYAVIPLLTRLFRPWLASGASRAPARGSDGARPAAAPPGPDSAP
ncbi:MULTISPECIES: hypothetical protein [unclassified Nocardiopsis]|uniref:hypothetical protein n=1 Tax=unclassified Nocardiopsis TaxID=2649073 RepID=UPI00135C2089|nr:MULTISPECIES: hypothetical protein [unclassified Nocardiopsis]